MNRKRFPHFQKDKIQKETSYLVNPGTSYLVNPGQSWSILLKSYNPVNPGPSYPGLILVNPGPSYPGEIQ